MAILSKAYKPDNFESRVFESRALESYAIQKKFFFDQNVIHVFTNNVTM